MSAMIEIPIITADPLEAIFNDDLNGSFPEKIVLMRLQSRFAAYCRNGEHGLCGFPDKETANKLWGKMQDQSGWVPEEFEFFEACQIARNRPPIKFIFFITDTIENAKKYPVD